MEPEPDPDPRKIARQKLTMGAFFGFLMAALAAADLFAFENGAFATISQAWLTVNRYCWPLTYALVIAVGILVQHVSVARDPAHGLNPPFLPQALLWTPAFWLGLWIGYRWLYQLPTVD